MIYNIYLPRTGAPLPDIANREVVPLFYQGGEQRDRFTATAVGCGLVRNLVQYVDESLPMT